MAKATRNGIFRCREIKRDRKIPCRYEIQYGQEIISQNILTYLPSQKKLENFTQEIHRMIDRHPESSKLSYSWTFVTTPYDN